MSSERSWIYDYDGLTFETYEIGRTAESLKHHTMHGEIIVHRSETGLLSVIEKQTVTPWPEDHNYTMFHYAWHPSDFA